LIIAGLVFATVVAGVWLIAAGLLK